MSLADFAAKMEVYKERLEAWERTERASARQAGKKLAEERESLIDAAPANGASRRAVAAELARPDIGPAISVELDEGESVGETVLADLA
jgi:hypothetical protein